MKRKIFETERHCRLENIVVNVEIKPESEDAI